MRKRLEKDWCMSANFENKHRREWLMIGRTWFTKSQTWEMNGGRKKKSCLMEMHEWSLFSFLTHLFVFILFFCVCEFAAVESFDFLRIKIVSLRAGQANCPGHAVLLSSRPGAALCQTVISLNSAVCQITLYNTKDPQVVTQFKKRKKFTSTVAEEDFFSFSPSFIYLRAAVLSYRCLPLYFGVIDPLIILSGQIVVTTVSIRGIMLVGRRKKSTFI